MSSATQQRNKMLERSMGKEHSPYDDCNDDDDDKSTVELAVLFRRWRKREDNFPS